MKKSKEEIAEANKIAARKSVRKRRAKKLGLSIEEYEERLKNKNTRRPITPEERLKLQNAIRLKWYHRKRAQELGMSLEDYESEGIYKRVETMEVMEEEELREVNSYQLLIQTEEAIQLVIEWFRNNPVTNPDYEAKCRELHSLEVKCSCLLSRINRQVNHFGIDEIDTYVLGKNGG